MEASMFLINSKSKQEGNPQFLNYRACKVTKLF